ncbi:hypothetical protein DFH94DRAFT_192147 [Russula ochroleuca]|uniref:AA9 family lytic polysaccharide monooxygenase n=1 Tax=Russula ochroleuca TaxID=152965 RepID=A0A9P5MR83_9AGAM|nr:hypothetical protein DFH94DRAFT_192147 [Russula ochroleuca]
MVNGQPICDAPRRKYCRGDCLVRSEIATLRPAVMLSGAEFHTCTQIRVGGQQTCTPNKTVLFPGAYNDNDPGIYNPNVYTGAAYISPSRTSFRPRSSPLGPSGGRKLVAVVHGEKCQSQPLRMVLVGSLRRLLSSLVARCHFPSFSPAYYTRRACMTFDVTCFVD